MKLKKRSKPQERGFTSDQYRYLKEHIRQMMSDFVAVGDPIHVMEILHYIKEHSQADRLNSYLKNEKYAKNAEFCRLAGLIHALRYQPKSTELFNNLPGCEDEIDISDKQIKSFLIDLDEMIDEKLQSVAQEHYISLTHEHKDYFLAVAITPSAENIAEFYINDPATAIFLLELVIRQVNPEEFSRQFAHKIADTYRGEQKEWLYQEILTECRNLLGEKTLDGPRGIFTQAVCEICSSAFNLYMLIRNPAKIKYVTNCHFKNSGGAGFTKKQLDMLSEFTKNELKIFADGLKAPVIMPSAKWQQFQDNFRKLQEQNARLEAENAHLKTRAGEAHQDIRDAEILRLRAEVQRLQTELALMTAPTKTTIAPSEAADTNNMEVPSESDSYVNFSESDDELPQAPSPKPFRPPIVANPVKPEASLEFAEECIARLVI